MREAPFTLHECIESAIEMVAPAAAEPAQRASRGLLTHKHALVLAASSVNRYLFGQLLPTVSATVDCVATERRATTLPESVTAARVARADLIIVELSLIQVIMQLMPTLPPDKHRTLVPLTTALGYVLLSIDFINSIIMYIVININMFSPPLPPLLYFGRAISSHPYVAQMESIYIEAPFRSTLEAS